MQGLYDEARYQFFTALHPKGSINGKTEFSFLVQKEAARASEVQIRKRGDSHSGRNGQNPS